MSVSEQGDKRPATQFLPQEARVFLRNRAMELAGLALSGLGVALIVALKSYDPADPSLNNATAATPTNLLARPGATAADILLQGFGIAGYVPALAIALWGARLMFHSGWPRLWLALPTLPVATLFAAGLIEQRYANAGGLAGQAVDRAIDYLLRLGEVPLPREAGLAVLALLSIPALILATDLRWSEAVGLARAVRLIGRAASHVSALFAGRQRVLVETPEAARARLEPTFDILPKGEKTARKAEAPEQPLEPATERPDKAERVEKKRSAPRQGKRAEAERQAALALEKRAEDFELPPLNLLAEPPPSKGAQLSNEALDQNAKLLERVLDDFGVTGQIVKVRPGPVVTLYELEPSPGTKSARVINLSDDIARSMSATAVRAAVVPGRNVIGIELPNARREAVSLREMLASETFEQTQGRLLLALGKDIGGVPVIADLARMPHLLVAGTTGSGKSVGVNAMILSLLYRLTPAECRMIMIDPKMLELSVYDGIPHLLTPVVTEAGKAVVALKWAVREMEDRYRKMSLLGVRNLEGYNERVGQARKKGEEIMRRVQTGYDPETRQPIVEEQPLDLAPLPHIVVIVDEFSDLMMVAGKDVEAAVLRLAQMARAAGIHLIMATQRPSVDVITGTIKANFPTRISFQVTSKIDSRTILGTQGAEQLLGAGDMLYMSAGGRIQRVHGPFVSDREVQKVADHLRDQATPEYLDEVTEDPDEGFDPAAMGAGGEDGGDDLYARALDLVRREQKASTSFIQRHLQIGYNRAARIIEQMEKEGIVSPPNHVGKREVLG